MNFFQLLIPYRSEIYKTSLTTEEINKRILKHTTIQKSLYAWDRGDKDFHGIKTEMGFRIKRTIFYRNSFLPIIHLDIRENVTERSVEMKMRMPWLITGILFFFLFVFSTISFGNSFLPKMPMERLFPIIFYVIVLFAFHIEAAIAIRGLKKILPLEKSIIP
jgi:hypothetical protein